MRREVGEPVGDHWRRHEQPPPLLLSRGWVAGVNLSFFDDSPRGREEQYDLDMEIRANGIAWPVQLHRGRWRILDQLLERWRAP